MYVFLCVIEPLSSDLYQRASKERSKNYKKKGFFSCVPASI